MDFGLTGEMPGKKRQRLEYYRQFVYEQGSLESAKGARLDAGIIDSEKKKGFQVGKIDRFRNRTRYFTDSGVIGTRAFVLRCHEMAMEAFVCLPAVPRAQKNELTV